MNDLIERAKALLKQEVWDKVRESWGDSPDIEASGPMVRVPVKPRPYLNSGAIALSEPDSKDESNGRR